MRHYRIVVIDDDPEVIQRVEGRISNWSREFEREVWQIELSLVQVTIEPTDADTYRISDTTIRELAQAFSQTPDLVFADYGFIRPTVLEEWREKSKTGHTITPNDLKGKFLTLVDLANSTREATGRKALSASLRSALLHNFLGFSGKVFLYSLTTTAFLPVLGELEFRRSRVQAAFPRASVTSVDTKYEFYNGEEFAQQKHEARFYAHLVSGLIGWSAQVAMLETMLARARKLKYLQIRRSIVSVGGIVAFGGGIAAVGGFLGERITDLLQRGDYPNAALVGGAGLVLVFTLGLALPFLFGTFMSGLLTSDEGNAEGTT